MNKNLTSNSIFVENEQTEKLTIQLFTLILNFKKKLQICQGSNFAIFTVPNFGANILFNSYISKNNLDIKFSKRIMLKRFDKVKNCTIQS
jgi:hypothetical protein